MDPTKAVVAALLTPALPFALPLLGIVDLFDGDDQQVRHAALQWGYGKSEIQQLVTGLDEELKRIPSEQTWRGDSYHAFNKSVMEVRQALFQLPELYEAIKTQLGTAADTLADAWVGIIAIIIAVVAAIVACLALTVPTAGGSLSAIPGITAGAMAAASSIVAIVATLWGVLGGNMKDWSGVKPFENIKNPEAPGNIETHHINVDLKHPGLWVDNQ
jgi:WXG100 family type VII secretion target